MLSPPKGHLPAEVLLKNKQAPTDDGLGLAYLYVFMCVAVKLRQQHRRVRTWGVRYSPSACTCRERHAQTRP